MNATVTYYSTTDLLLCLGDDVKINLRSRLYGSVTPVTITSIRAAVVPPIDEVSRIYTFEYDNTEGLDITECDITSVEKWECCQQVEQLELRHEALLTYLGLEEDNNGNITPV